MAIDITTMKELAKLGCNLHLDSVRSATDVKNIITLASTHEAHITINGSKFDYYELKEFASLGKKNITIIV